MKKASDELVGTEKEFMDIFRTLCYSRNAWQVWDDLITAIACSLSNVTDRSAERYEQREKEYKQCVERLGSVEIPAKLMAIIVMALERNPEQDFLGKIFMGLNLGSHWKGQFFTPYSVCELMTKISISEGRNDEELKQRGYITVNDPACGAGATLIAAVNLFRARNINYQRQVLFVAQDVDRVAGLMCYIQLSLLGCAGYVAIANTITNPLVGDPLIPLQKEGQEFWFMPMFAMEPWSIRKILISLSRYDKFQSHKKEPANNLEEKSDAICEKETAAIGREKSKQQKSKDIIEGQMSIFDLM